MSGERLEGDEWGALALGVGQVSGGDEAAEVGVALAGLGEEHQVVRVGGRLGRSARRRLCARAVGAAAPPHRRGDAALGVAPAGCDSQQRLHPHLGPEDGLDAVLGAGLGEAHRAVEAVVVGESQGRLPQLGRPGDQLLDPAAAVEEREVGVHVQVDERSRRRAAGGRQRFVCAVGGRGILRAVFCTGAVLPDVVVARRDPLHREPVQRVTYGRVAWWRLAFCHRTTWLVAEHMFVGTSSIANKCS